MSISNIGMRQNQVDPEFERSESLVELSHSISIASLFPPYNSDTDASSESDETASRFSRLSLTISSSFSRVLFSPPPTTNLSIPSLFPPTISDTESEKSNQTPPRLSNSIDSIFPPTRSPPYRSDTVLVTSINDVNHFYQAGTTAKVTPTNLTTSPSLNKLNLDTPVQALLQVAIKNGQPLFTFAVDNDSNILAATMKKLNTTIKGEYSTVYTFFTIQVKKKNRSWINLGGKSKGKGQDYISNVVAQMKVSDSQFPNMIRQHCMDQFSMREFVLFSVDLRQADQQTFDFQPNDELAAVVVNFPKSINRSATRDGSQNNHYNDLLEVGSKEQLPGVECNSNTGENVQKLPSVSVKNLVNATVILPSAVHSIPSKGGPSSLIERWKSGGLCDCGGWDLGCKLQILASQNHISSKLGSPKACSVTDKFELFCQEGVQVNQPFLSLSQYKDGIYSVEFSSPLSILQAFSICIAVLDSKKACELSESSDF